MVGISLEASAHNKLANQATKHSTNQPRAVGNTEFEFPPNRDRTLFQTNNAEICGHFEKLSAYRQFCCPASFISKSRSSSANVPVSLQFLRCFIDQLNRPPF